MPERLKRRYKARGKTTPVAIAIGDVDGRTQMYAGLPVSQAGGLPFSLNAQFDIDTARHGIQHDELNGWLFARASELAAGVALHRLLENPREAWRGMPLKSDLWWPEDQWLGDRIGEVADLAQKRIRRGFNLPIGGLARRLKELTYEAAPLEGLLSPAEAEGLRSRLTLVPKSARDREGRWRSVLGELGGAQLIDVQEALELLDWEDSELGPHDARWFIKLARAGIDQDLGRRLWQQRSIVTLDGIRIVPPMPNVEGELLLRQAQNDSLAARLGIAHVIDPAYLSRSPDAAVVRDWLETNDMLRDTPDAAATLRALAARDVDAEPLPVADDELLLLRDAFLAIDQSAQVELGPQVGRVIAIDVHRWQGGKRSVGIAVPAQSYLPGSIEDRKDGWSKAAGKTPGIAWVHPRYRDVLLHPGRRKPGSGPRRQLAARAFFGLLGAETAPRILEPEDIETRYGDPASPIDPGQLAPPQREALGRLQRHTTHLKNDHRSPDLLAVLRDLQRERGMRVRRVRARALLATLDREWSRLYGDHATATAVWSYSNWHVAGTIPATWLAFAMSEPWLSSEAGETKPPRELAVRTPGNEAVFGDDRSSFAYEVDESEAASPALRALGIATDPEVGEMVDQLETLRESGSQPDERALSLRYAAIAIACRNRDPLPDDMVGDLSVRRLRARFGTQPTKPGLIYAAGRWLPPSRVFLGAPIFGNRAAFVSERSSAEKLWRVLRIASPSLSDCIDVLEEIARAEPGETEEQILVNTYLQVEDHLPDASARELSHLKNLPLWTGTTWQKGRPIYAVSDADLARALSTHIPVWQLPVSASAVERLAVAVDVTRLREEAFDPSVHERAFVTGAPLERSFGRAVELLRDWLTRHDSKLVDALSIPWQELANSRIAVDPNLRLELRLGRRTSVEVPARAHVVREGPAFYFADIDAPAEDDAGGRVVAALFSDGDRDKVALAWSRSWARAEQGDRGHVSLAQDHDDGAALSSLFEQSKGTTIPRRQKGKAKAKESGGRGLASPQPLSARHLKRIEDFGSKAVEIVEGTKPGSAKTRGKRGLRDDTPSGSPVGMSRPAPQSAPRAYSDEEKEELAIQILQFAINGEFTDLRDYRHLRGVGADALDKLRRYFEIKATYGELKDDITLTANEAERAFREGAKFFLAVIGGLEEGYETVVRIVPNPLRTLKLSPTTSVTLTGIATGQTALEIRFPASSNRSLQL